MNPGYEYITEALSRVQMDIFRQNVLQPFVTQYMQLKNTNLFLETFPFKTLFFNMSLLEASVKLRNIIPKDCTLTGNNFECLHIRSPRQTKRTKWPILGWHLDRNALSNSNRLLLVGILHCSDVAQEGGGTTVLRGSHLFMRKLPFLPHIIMLIICQIIAWSYILFWPIYIEELTAKSGDVVLLDPALIHSTTKNRNDQTRYTFRFACYH